MYRSSVIYFKAMVFKPVGLWSHFHFNKGLREPQGSENHTWENTALWYLYLDFPRPQVGSQNYYWLITISNASVKSCYMQM